jgi:hypothetical protein
MVEATSGGATSRAIISVRGGVVSRPHPAPGTARGRVAASGQTGFANRVRFQSLVDQCSGHVSVNTRIITVAGAQGDGMSEDIAPYIVGFTRVTLGDQAGFTYDESDEEPLFSWLEEGRIVSLPWSEAVRRFGALQNDQSALVARKEKPFHYYGEKADGFRGSPRSVSFIMGCSVTASIQLLLVFPLQ